MEEEEEEEEEEKGKQEDHSGRNASGTLDCTPRFSTYRIKLIGTFLGFPFLPIIPQRLGYSGIP